MIHIALALSLATFGVQDTKEEIKNNFKQAGKNIAEATRPPRMAIKQAAKKVGKAFKEGGKAIGQGAKTAGSAIGKGAKTAAKGVSKGAREATEKLKDSNQSKDETPEK